MARIIEDIQSYLPHSEQDFLSHIPQCIDFTAITLFVESSFTSFASLP